MENLKPQVSVLLPVRQWHDNTLQAITSILQQSLSSLELLIIGHQDVHGLASQLPADSRIKLVARDAPGIVGALNTGLAKARGEYIARMDDDDIAYPTRLVRQLELLQHEVQLCATRVRFIDQNNSTEQIGEGNQRYENWLNTLTNDQEIRRACHIECPMPHPTWMAHRNVWQQIGPYRQTDGPEDYDWVLRAYLHNIRMGKPHEVLLDWREHANRLTHKDRRYRREAFVQCSARALVDPRSGSRLAEGRGVWLCGTGRHARQWHDALESQSVTVRGFVDVHRHGPERSKRGKSVISYQQLPGLRHDNLVIGALTQQSARHQLRQFFAACGWLADQEYVICG